MQFPLETHVHNHHGIPLERRVIIDCRRCGLGDLLRSSTIGIDIDTDSLYVYRGLILCRRTAALKYASGTLSQFANVPTSDELLALMQK